MSDLVSVPHLFLEQDGIMTSITFITFTSTAKWNILQYNLSAFCLGFENWAAKSMVWFDRKRWKIKGTGKFGKRFYCFSSSSSSSSTILLFFLLLLNSIVFPPPPPSPSQFSCFPSSSILLLTNYKILASTILNSFYGHVLSGKEQSRFFSTVSTLSYSLMRVSIKDCHSATSSRISSSFIQCAL